MKSQIVEQLGQSDLRLPSLIADGLVANDRVKTRLSVLQAAARRAREPSQTRFDLTAECRTVGIDPVPLEMLVNNASSLSDARIAAPGVGALGRAMRDDVDAMMRAIEAGASADGAALRARLAAIEAAGWPDAADTIDFAQVARLTGLGEDDGDSLHRLVMDLHKALNRLSAAHAEELLAGAHVFGLADDDRPAVEAFMRGVEATRRLKFDHPGLATTAIRAGGRLTIQNDIGETDAHVVVIAVEPDAVTLTYTDVHLARAKFFTGLFRNFAVQWSGLDRKTAPGLGIEGVFYLVTGRYPTDGARRREAFLEAIGASLVFLIDWNKTRKLLRTWVSKSDAFEILDWAARHRCGQRGFLELGGADLIASAVHRVAPTRIGFGERLDQALGREAAVDFLKSVLRVSAEALIEGGSVRLARDRIEAELVRHLQGVDATLLAVVVSQAGLAREIAAGIGDLIAAAQARRPFDRAALAARARRIEEKADKIASDARSEIGRFDADPAIERLVNQAENAIDELEQAAFVASLVPAELAPDLLTPLAALAAAAIAGAEAAAAGTEAAAEVPEGHRVDSEDALAAVGRLIEAEHSADDAERAVTTAVLRDGSDLKTALSVLDLARAIERATDRLAGFAHLLRERVLADLAT
jgi:uncharacterized protein Yka (UPF0111/DUF47 family)